MTGTLLRIFLTEGQRHENEPLYRAVIARLLARGCSGATVLKGVEGFGIRKHVRTARLVDYSGDLPVVIEVIDEREKIESMLAELREMIPEGLITMESLEYIALKGGRQ